MASTSTRLLMAGLCLLFGARAVAEADARCVAVAVTVDVPPARAWALMSDFTLAHNYVPDLARTEILSARKRGVGAHRRVYQEDGDYLEETIIEWTEGSGFVLSLHEGQQPLAPFKRAEFSYGMAAVTTTSTEVDLSLTVEMPWGAVGEALLDWFVEQLLEDNLVQVAAGLKYFYETGQPATDKEREGLASAVQLAPTGSGCP